MQFNCATGSRTPRTFQIFTIAQSCSLAPKIYQWGGGIDRILDNWVCGLLAVALLAIKRRQLPSIPSGFTGRVDSNLEDIGTYPGVSQDYDNAPEYLA
jgi:hypothetical protein